MDKYLTAKQAARILQVDLSVVYGYIKDKQLKAYKLGGNGKSKRHYRIKEADIEAFITRGRVSNDAGTSNTVTK